MIVDKMDVTKISQTKIFQVVYHIIENFVGFISSVVRIFISSVDD